LASGADSAATLVHQCAVALEPITRKFVRIVAPRDGAIEPGAAPMRNESEGRPFEWNDRIDHHVFGLGTVTGEPRPAGSAGNGRQATWLIQVTWDDIDRPPSSILSSHLRLISRPDAKGGVYWRNEYQNVLEPALRARQHVNDLMSKAYRGQNGDDVEALKEALSREKAVVFDVVEFLDADERGDHP